MLATSEEEAVLRPAWKDKKNGRPAPARNRRSCNYTVILLPERRGIRPISVCTRGGRVVVLDRHFTPLHPNLDEDTWTRDNTEKKEEFIVGVLGWSRLKGESSSWHLN